MRKLSPRLLLGSIIASALLAGPAVAQDKTSELHQVMAKSMQDMKSMQMTGDVDRDFATMMKHHHQSGVDMAQVQAKNGKDPEMRKFAQKIIAAQKQEIAELDRWLQTKGSGGAGASGNSGSGTSSSGSAKGAEHSGHGGTK